MPTQTESIRLTESNGDIDTITQNVSGTSLPHILSAAAVVEYDNTFNIIGGYSGIGIYSDKILKYDPDGRQWMEVPATLSEGKGVWTAIKVKASFLKTC